MSFESSFIASKSFEGESAVLRVDYNVPIENGVLLDDERLLRSIPTIEYILEQTNDLKIIYEDYWKKLNQICVENGGKPVLK